MSQHKFVCDNSGHRVAPCACTGDAVPASGQKLVVVAADTLTVEAGAKYLVHALLLIAPRSIVLSTTGVTSVAANIEWVVPANKSIVLTVPVGKTTLYIGIPDGAVILYLSKLT